MSDEKHRHRRLAKRYRQEVRNLTRVPRRRKRKRHHWSWSVPGWGQANAKRVHLPLDVLEAWEGSAPTVRSAIILLGVAVVEADPEQLRYAHERVLKAWRANEE